MYKKVTKIKRVTKKYTKPPFKVVEVIEHGDDDDDDEVETKIYGDTVQMDLPFFVKLLEYVHNKVNTTTELQAIAQTIIDAAKVNPCLTGDTFEQIVSY